MTKTESKPNVMTEEAKLIVIEFYKKAVKDIKIITPENKCICGGVFVKRRGPRGEFYGCNHYPDCTQSKELYELKPYVKRASIQWVNDCRMILADLGIKASIHDVTKVIEDAGLPSLWEIEESENIELQKQERNI